MVGAGKYFGAPCRNDVRVRSGSICRHSTKSSEDTFSDVGEAVGSVRSLFLNLWWNTVVYTGCSPVIYDLCSSCGGKQ